MDLVQLALGHTYLLLLIFGRMMGLLVTAPVLAHRLVPVQVRVALGLGLAVVVLPVLAGSAPPAVPPDLVTMIVWLVQEMTVGLVIGFVAALGIAAVQFAGALLDADLGYAMATVFDPASGQTAAVLGGLYHTLALLIFLVVDGHHALIRAVLASYVAIPQGGVALTGSLLDLVVNAAGGLLRAGLGFALPVMAALFVTTVALAVVGRAVPQVNLLAVGLPAKMAAGLALLVLLLPVHGPALVRQMEAVLADVARALAALAG